MNIQKNKIFIEIENIGNIVKAILSFMVKFVIIQIKIDEI